MTQPRHREEANIFDMRSPHGKAKAMASYCTDASRILAYVTNYYGRPCGLTLADCAAMIERQRRYTGRNIPDWPDEAKPKLTLVETPVVRELMFKKPPEPEAEPEPQPVPDAGFDARILIDRVADAFHITHGELIGGGRSCRYVEARVVVVAVLRQRRWSYPRIGKLLGGRDHSTVINSFQTFDIHAKRNPLVAKCFNHYRPAQPKPRTL